MNHQPPYDDDTTISIPAQDVLKHSGGEPDILSRLGAVFDQVPHLPRILAEIDSRALFSSGLIVMLKLAALFAMVFGGIVLFAGAIEAFTGNEISTVGTQIMGGIVVLAFLIPLFLSGIVMYRRCDRLQFEKGGSTIDLMLKTLSTFLLIAAEVAAIGGLFVVLLQGLVNLIMGDSGAFQYAVYYGSDALANLVFGSSSADTSWLVNRIYGLVLIVMSGFVSFGILISAYLGIDLTKLFWKWFMMFVNFIRRILTNTFHRSEKTA